MSKAANATLEPGMVMTRETAVKEVNDYLSFKGMRPKRRKEKEESIDVIIDCVEDGTVSIDPETRILKHKLIHPIKGTKEFNYKARINQGKIATRLRMSSSSDGHSAIACYVAELSDNNITFVGMLDTEDNVISNAVAMLFM